jgi:hypothetical protein
MDIPKRRRSYLAAEISEMKLAVDKVVVNAQWHVLEYVNISRMQ